VPNQQGIHVRPAQQIAEVATRFKSEIIIRRGQEDFDAKSTMRLLELAAQKGTRLSIRACGEDAEEAVAALIALVESGFGEE